MSFFKKLFGKKSETLSNKSQGVVEIKKNKKSGFSTWTIKEVVKETADAVSVHFEKPEGFVFKPGQFLTLKADIEGKEVRREYSFCKSPFEDTVAVAIKQTPDGYFSKFAQGLQAGQKIDVMGPNGSFYIDINTEANNYIGFAGGSGITPLSSIVKTVILKEPQSTIKLFYANRDVDSIIFKNELEQLAQDHSDQFELIHVLESETLPEGGNFYQGRIDAEKIKLFSQKYFNATEVTGFLMCGPRPMIDGISASLEELGVEKSRIKFELFTAAKDAAAAPVNAEIVVPATIAYNFNGEENQVEYSDQSKSILDFLLDNDHDVPYSCRKGTCGTCCCKLSEGSVHQKMDGNALSDEVREQGYILGCMSYPTSDKVKVDFDDYIS